MFRSIPKPLRRLAHPRSERAGLWACVYCGAIEDHTAGDEGSTRSAD